LSAGSPFPVCLIIPDGRSIFRAPGATESDVRRWHGSVFAPYFVPGCVARSSALISRICARTALRASTFSRVQTPCLKLPLRSPWGPPEPLAPPCIPCPTTNCCLSTGVTGSSARSAPRGFGQIREPSFYVGLMHGSWSFLTTTLSMVGALTPSRRVTTAMAGVNDLAPEILVVHVTPVEAEPTMPACKDGVASTLPGKRVRTYSFSVRSKAAVPLS
jgi:hypothetical protein